MCDVAAFEIACAKVDADPPRESDGMTGTVHSGSIRRCPSVMLLRCAYDVRPIFEPGPAKAVPVKRDTLLVVAMPRGAEGAQVYEVIAAIFDLLAALDGWIDLNGMDADPDFAKLLANLAARGLIARPAIVTRKRAVASFAAASAPPSAVLPTSASAAQPLCNSQRKLN
jgi:hypothetical protein